MQVSHYDFLLKTKYSHTRSLGKNFSLRSYPRFLVVLIYLGISLLKYHLNNLDYDINLPARMKMHAETFYKIDKSASL